MKRSKNRVWKLKINDVQAQTLEEQPVKGRQLQCIIIKSQIADCARSTNNHSQKHLQYSVVAVY